MSLVSRKEKLMLAYLSDIPLTIPLIGLGVIIFLLILFSGYVKAPPDQAYIISGLKKDSRILVGRAGIKIPYLERLDRQIGRAHV